MSNDSELRRIEDKIDLLLSAVTYLNESMKHSTEGLMKMAVVMEKMAERQESLLND